MKIKPLENHGGVRVELGPQESQLPSVSEIKPTVFKLREILVPVDFTECTQKALFYAIPFARQFGASITLLHVVEQAFIPASEMGVVVPVDASKEAKAELEKLRLQVGRQVRCQALLRKGGRNRNRQRSAGIGL